MQTVGETRRFGVDPTLFRGCFRRGPAAFADQGYERDGAVVLLHEGVFAGAAHQHQSLMHARTDWNDEPPAYGQLPF